jgi:hypothetical protein
MAGSNFPTSGPAGVRVKGGDVNAYKILSALAGLIVCGNVDCVDKAIGKYLPKDTKPQAAPDPTTPSETQVIQRREALSGGELERSHLCSNYSKSSQSISSMTLSSARLNSLS